MVSKIVDFLLVHGEKDPRSVRRGLGGGGFQPWEITFYRVVEVIQLLARRQDHFDVPLARFGYLGKSDFFRAQSILDLLNIRFGRIFDRLVRFNLQHEVDTTLEIQAEMDLIRQDSRQPRQGSGSESRYEAKNTGNKNYRNYKRTNS